MPPRRSARIAARRVVPEAISWDDADTECLTVSAVCEACNKPASTRHMEHFPCCNFFAHRDCVDDGVDALCPFCRMDVRDVLNGGPHVRCCLCEGLVDAQGSGEEAVHVFSFCPRVLFHVRCLAATTSSRSPEVSCTTCPASLGDSVSLDWFTRLCHIRVGCGVQHPSPLLPSVIACHLPRPQFHDTGTVVPVLPESLFRTSSSSGSHNVLVLPACRSSYR